MTIEYTSGEWQNVEQMTDYRSERFTDMLVERATWTQTAPTHTIDGIKVAAPDYIWFRFWLLGQQQIVEKYFDADRHLVGMYAPISTPFLPTEKTISSVSLALALWLQEDGRITVLNEAEFDAAIAAQVVSPVEATYAEHRIRELMLDIGQNLFPPAMVRNFILKGPEES